MTVTAEPHTVRGGLAAYALEGKRSLLPWAHQHARDAGLQALDEQGSGRERATPLNMPKDFVPRHYLIANPDLWDLHGDEAATTHYLQVGRTESRPYRRPFVPEFYRALYGAQSPNGASTGEGPPASSLDSFAYWSLNEVLFDNGFSPPMWLTHFSWSDYITYNSLAGVLENETQALVHFITVGVQMLLALRDGFEFDVDLIRELANEDIEKTDAEIYKIWLEQALPRGSPANKQQAFEQLGLEIGAIPASFDWKRYMAESLRVDQAVRRNRWTELEHFAQIGAIGRVPMPVDSHEAESLLRAIADRFARAGKNKEAGLIYDRCLLYDGPSVESIQHAADLAFREERFARAFHLYQQVRTRNDANFWTYLNGGRCALKLADFAAASEWIEAGLASFPRSEPLWKLYLEIQGGAFQMAVNRHIGTVSSGNGAVSEIEEDLRGIYESLARAHLLQHRDWGENGGKQNLPHRAEGLAVAMLANFDLPQCTYYRVTQKLEQQVSASVTLHVFAPNQTTQFMSAASVSDIVIFYRLAASLETLQCLSYCHVRDIPTVYEVDDLVFDPEQFPDALNSYHGAITAEDHLGLRCGVHLMKFYLQNCDYGIASTEGLKEKMTPLVKRGRVFVHRNVLPHRTELTAGSRKPHGSDRGKTTIFYGSATLAHAGDFAEQIEPALMRLMYEFPNVELVTCGYVDTSRLQARLPSRTRHVEYIPNRDAYLALLASVSINLAVLQRNPFNNCKSEIKWLEAAALGIPSVVSDVDVYREVLTPGVDVITTEPEPGAWYAALRALIVDPRWRRQIGANARRTALLHHDAARAARRFGQELRAIVTGGSAPAPGCQVDLTVRERRRRVLLVNVFFPPQAIGGATRIVAAEVKQLREQYGDDIEVGVLCGNDEGAAPYELTTYMWHGTPVYSINTPVQLYMDWIDRDPRIGPVFATVLHRFQPDLVHFHCIQRLTSVVIEEVIARSVPYVVTVHDAWWISDYQFLVDESNRLAFPWEDEGRQSAGEHPWVESIERRQRLAACLNRAKCVLAVSESFAKIYRRAGIKGVRALENGLPELPALEPQQGSRGRLRLGHFGGTAYIKGLFIVKRALMRGSYPELELLIVDLSMGHCEVKHELWGATQVRRIGRVPQDRIGWLYGQVDVVLTPSVWPESFGLVVREALHYGKWVIASNRGALPDAIIPEVNGFVIDVDDPQALPALFAQVVADQYRFKRPPSQTVAITTMNEHMRRLRAVYDEVLCPGATNVPKPRNKTPRAQGSSGKSASLGEPAGRFDRPGTRRQLLNGKRPAGSSR